MSESFSRKVAAKWMFHQDQNHLCWGNLLSVVFDVKENQVYMTYDSDREVILHLSDASENPDLDFSRAEITQVQMRVPLTAGDGHISLPLDLDGMRHEKMHGDMAIGDAAGDDCGFVDRDGDTCVVGRMPTSEGRPA